MMLSVHTVNYRPFRFDSDFLARRYCISRILASNLYTKCCTPDGTVSDWSSGTIPASGAGGPGFDSRIRPFITGITQPAWRSMRR